MSEGDRDAFIFREALPRLHFLKFRQGRSVRKRQFTLVFIFTLHNMNQQQMSLLGDFKAGVHDSTGANKGERERGSFLPAG